MRRTSLALTIAVLLAAAPAAAQQGSVQVVAGGVVTTGDAARTGGLDGYQSDVGFSWRRPTVDWGIWTIEAHGVRNDSTAQFGRALFAIQDLKRGDTRWNVTAGDTAYTPLLRDYAFTNLFAPQVTFRGGSVGALNPTTSFSVTAGKVTVLRDLFAANADVLGQTLVVARGSHKASDRVEFVAHVSSVRTENVKEYTYDIKAGDDVGAGMRFNLTRRVQLIADAGLTSYVRKGEDTRQQKATFLAGARWSDGQGWLQVDAYQFAPGNFSVVNNPYDDRRGVFAGGEYAFNKLRLFGGWDVFRRNLEPAAQTSYGEGVSSRAYAGVRVPVNSHLFVGGRVEDGARTSKPSRYNVGYESDTGVRALDWQVTFPKWTAIGRYEQRSNVDTQGLLASTTFNQRDVGAEVFFNVTNASRIIARVLATDRRDEFGNSGQSFWQASAGTEFQITKRNLYGRAEVIVGRSHDFQSPFLMPHSAFSGGLSGQIRNHLSLSLDVYVDRSPVGMSKSNPWMSRTIGRLIYTLPTGSPSPLTSVARAAKGGSETIDGVVFVDWNANGVQDPDEETLPGVRVEVDRNLGALADSKGRFRFERLAAGMHVVAVDLNTIPASFDAPISPLLELTVKRGVAPTTAFGVLPLGDVEGVVVRDANGSGTIDENDEPLDDAVLVLDDGARTEISHKGRFRFTGVRLGTHKVELLTESLPEGAALAGERRVEVQIARSQMTGTAQFLVKLEKRPEVRKVFPPKKPDQGKPDSKSGGTVQGSGAAKTGQAGAKTSGSTGAGASKGHRSRRPNARSSQTRH